MFLARRLILVLVVLTALGGSVAYFTTEMGLTGSPEKIRQLGWVVFALMTALSIIMIILIWQSLSRSLRRIRNQLRQFEAEDKIGMIMIDEKDELAEMVGAINHYLTQIKTHFLENRIQQKELEIQAWVSEAERRQTEAIIYSISEAVLVTDKFDALLVANQAAQKLFRFSLKACYRHLIDEVIDDEELLELIHQTRKNKSRSVTRLLERRDLQKGKSLSLKIMLSCVLNQKEEIIGVVVVIHDMTAEKEIARMKDDFVSSVSHELKTPLASIRAYAEMLTDDEAKSENEWKEFCETIQEQAKRLNRLIDNILNISRIESGLMRITRKKLNIAAVVAEVIATMRAQAREKDIDLVCDLNSNELIVSADRDMIFQAVMNLLSNAMKYSHPGQKVILRVGENNQHQAVIEVLDNGVGIPPHCLERIFDKFYRVEENISFSSGTGLGLHLVKQIVQVVHDGHVEVKTTPGRGSTFTILLPLCQSPALVPA